MANAHRAGILAAGKETRNAREKKKRKKSYVIIMWSHICERKENLLRFNDKTNDQKVT